MTDELKNKIDTLLENGYVFDFMDSSEGMKASVVGIIRVPYAISDYEFVKIVDLHFEKITSVVNSARSYIQSKTKPI